MTEMVRRLTHGPAKILGLPYGTLAPGAAADVCIFDPEHIWLLDKSSMQSHGHNTPFLGRELKGRVVHTLLAGNLVYSLEC
jgi:dihydroorotase